MCVGLARVGAEDQRIIAGTMQQLAHTEFGPPLHSLILAGDTHILEQEVLALYKYVAPRNPDR